MTKLGILDTSRRQFIAGSAAVMAVPVLPISQAKAAADPLILTFLRVSSLLTGIDLDRSYIQLGEELLTAIIKSEPGAEATRKALFDLVDGLPSTVSDEDLGAQLENAGIDVLALAQKIARVWYTGMIELPDENGNMVAQVLTYDDALVWQACDWTKPPATCGGNFGYWQNPYSGQEE